MRYWIIIHSLAAFNEHKDYIGIKKNRARMIEGLSKGDKIVYYATGDSVVVGTFDVISNKQEWENDKYWKGPHICMKIKPRMVSRPPQYIGIHKLIEQLEPPLSLFPEKKFKPIKFKGRTAVEITKNDFEAIENFLKYYKHEDKNLFRGRANDENLGEPMDLEVMNYAPTSEQGVVVLFAHFMGEIKGHQFVKIEFIRQGFPDACAIERIGNNYARKYIEFEFKASKFREHVKNETHKETRCDYVVCWENDYPTCPVEVIELKRELASINRSKSEKI